MTPDRRQPLALDERDPGCEPGIENLHRYVEIETSGGDPAESFPEIATHLLYCAACRADHDALVEAVEELGDAAPSN
jgi:hypothetical protein